MVIIITDKANKNIVLLIVSLGNFLIPFMLMSVNIALPAIGAEFAIDAVILGWVATSYVLASVMFLIPFGKVADIYGRKKVFTMGFAVFALSSFMSAYAGSALILIITRFVQGIGGAMVFSTGLAILMAVTPLAERGRNMGLTIGMVYFGQAVGPYLGGLLAENYGWRSIFYLPLPVCLIILSLVWWNIKMDWREAREEKLDYASSIIFTTSLLLIMLGLSIVPDQNSIWLLAAGFFCLFSFIWREKTVESPLVDLRLFTGNRVFTFSNLAALLNYSATHAVIFLISLYLQYIHVLTPQSAGLFLMVKAVVQGVFTPVAGSLADRMNPGIFASLGMGVTAASLFLLAFLDGETPFWYIALALAILGLGIGLFVSPNSYVIMSAVEKQHYGVSTAMIGTMRLTGQVVSMAVVMFIFALSIGRVEITPLYFDAFLVATRSAFLVFGFLSLVGVYLSLARGKIMSRRS